MSGQTRSLSVTTERRAYAASLEVYVAMHDDLRFSMLDVFGAGALAGASAITKSRAVRMWLSLVVKSVGRLKQG